MPTLKTALLDLLPAPIRSGLRRLRSSVERATWPDPELPHLSEVAAHARDVEVVSCDLFDTLVMRDVEPPGALKRPMAAFAARRLSELGLPIDLERFLAARDEVEVRLRRGARERGLDPESTLSEIVDGTLARLFDGAVAGEHSAELVQYEIEFERGHILPAPGALELLQTLEAAGKRILVTSDTYLEVEHLRLLLRHVGLERHVQQIYASSEHTLGKYSGRLFRRILEREEIQPAALLHFGDSFESDVRGARRGGVRGLLLHDREQLARRERLKRETKRSQKSAASRD